MTPPSSAPSGPARSSSEWYHWFQANAVAPDDVPWESRTRLSAAEREAVAASIQEFQLGESSEGRHLHAAARAHAAATGDDAYVRAIEAFIREEQRHARLLGRFLAGEGIPLRRKSWADGAFRALRPPSSCAPRRSPCPPSPLPPTPHEATRAPRATHPGAVAPLHRASS
jgi:hypothetical protein